MKSKKHLVSAIINLVTIVFLGLYLLGIFNLKPFLGHQVHKFLHIASAILFLGNIVIGPIWFFAMFKSSSIQLRKKLIAFLSFTDLLITIPFYLLTIFNGVVLASMYGDIKSYWIRHTLWDLLAFGIILLPVIFYQDKIYQGLNANVDVTRNYRSWKVFGLISAIPIIHVFYLMIFKPF